MYDELRDVLLKRRHKPGIEIQLPMDGDELWVEVPFVDRNDSIFRLVGNDQLFELFLACIDIEDIVIKINISGAVSNIEIRVFDIQDIELSDSSVEDMVDYMREVFDTCVEIDMNNADFDMR
jgi:hypothetical protein